MFHVFTSTRTNQQEPEKGIYFQIELEVKLGVRTNEDTFEANTLLKQTGPSNDNSKNFGSGY